MPNLQQVYTTFYLAMVCTVIYIYIYIYVDSCVPIITRGMNQLDHQFLYTHYPMTSMQIENQSKLAFFHSPQKTAAGKSLRNLAVFSLPECHLAIPIQQARTVKSDRSNYKQL